MNFLTWLLSKETNECIIHKLLAVLTWPDVWLKTTRRRVLASTGGSKWRWTAAAANVVGGDFTWFQNHRWDSMKRYSCCRTFLPLLYTHNISLAAPPSVHDELDGWQGVWCFTDADGYEQNVIRRVPPETERHLIKTFPGHGDKKSKSITAALRSFIRSLQMSLHVTSDSDARWYRFIPTVLRT